MSVRHGHRGVSLAWSHPPRPMLPRLAKRILRGSRRSLPGPLSPPPPKPVTLIDELLEQVGGLRTVMPPESTVRASLARSGLSTIRSA